MLVEAGCRAVIIAHSERRQFFGETDESANKKVQTAIAAGLTPILCVGETLAEREDGKTEGSPRTAIPRRRGCVDRCRVLAYHSCLRAGLGDWHRPHCDTRKWRLRRTGSCGKQAAASFSPDRAAGLRILYGGSVKPDNCKGLMAQVDIDGALVGGASLNAEAFASIVNF